MFVFHRFTRDIIMLGKDFDIDALTLHLHKVVGKRVVLCEADGLTVQP